MTETSDDAFVTKFLDAKHREGACVFGPQQYTEALLLKMIRLGGCEAFGVPEELFTPRVRAEATKHGYTISYKSLTKSKCRGSSWGMGSAITTVSLCHGYTPRYTLFTFLLGASFGILATLLWRR